MQLKSLAGVSQMDSGEDDLPFGGVNEPNVNPTVGRLIFSCICVNHKQEK